MRLFRVQQRKKYFNWTVYCKFSFNYVTFHNGQEISNSNLDSGVQIIYLSVGILPSGQNNFTLVLIDSEGYQFVNTYIINISEKITTTITETSVWAGIITETTTETETTTDTATESITQPASAVYSTETTTVESTTIELSISTIISHNVDTTTNTSSSFTIGATSLGLMGLLLIRRKRRTD